MFAKIKVKFGAFVVFLALASCSNSDRDCELVVTFQTSVANMTARPECFSNEYVRLKGYAEVNQFGISLYPTSTDRSLQITGNAVLIPRKGNEFGGYPLTPDQIEKIDVIEVYGFAISVKEIINVSEFNLLASQSEMHSE